MVNLLKFSASIFRVESFVIAQHQKTRKRERERVDDVPLASMPAIDISVYKRAKFTPLFIAI